MKKSKKGILIVLTALMTLVLSACSKPVTGTLVISDMEAPGLNKVITETHIRVQASSYLKLWLDANYHQEYSEYAKYLGEDEEVLKAEIREKELQDVAEIFSGGDAFIDTAASQQEELLNAINEVYQKADYQIGLAKVNESGQYVIPLTISPIRALQVMNENFEQEALGRFTSIPSEEEWIDFTIEMLRKYNTEAGYGDPVTLEIILDHSLGTLFYLSEAEVQNIENTVLPVD